MSSTVERVTVGEIAGATGLSDAEALRSVRDLLARGWMRPAWEPGSAGEGHYLLIADPDADPGDDEGDEDLCVMLDVPGEDEASKRTEEYMLAAAATGMPLASVWLLRAVAAAADADGHCASDALEDYLGAPRGAFTS